MPLIFKGYLGAGLLEKAVVSLSFKIALSRKVLAGTLFSIIEKKEQVLSQRWLYEVVPPKGYLTLVQAGIYGLYFITVRRTLLSRLSWEGLGQ